MTKTLTEQWREGTLPTGYYYFNNGKETHAGCYIQGEYCPNGITVIAPVPTYEEYQKLKEQLADAEEVIKGFWWADTKGNIDKYKMKWGNK